MARGFFAGTEWRPCFPHSPLAVKRRPARDVPFHWVFLAFGAFIVACGATHLMEVWTLWSAAYWTAGVVKAVTAVASVATALILPPLVPKALELIRHAKLREQLYEEQAMRAEAEAANRAKDEFLATISHELRTPLNAVYGWTRLLRSGDLDAEASHRALETIERNAHAQVRLIDDLLDVSPHHHGQDASRRSADGAARGDTRGRGLPASGGRGERDHDRGAARPRCRPHRR